MSIIDLFLKKLKLKYLKIKKLKLKSFDAVIIIITNN